MAALTDTDSKSMRPLLFVLFLSVSCAGWAVGPVDSAAPSAVPESAAVQLDGEVLFRLRGISAFPAARRAEVVQTALRSVARDASIATESGRVVAGEGRKEVWFGDTRVVTLFPEDAALEQVDLDILAEVVLYKSREAVARWREDRSRSALLQAGLWLIAIVVGTVLLVALLSWTLGRLHRFVERRVRQQLEQLERSSQRIFDAAQAWAFVGGLIQLVKWLSIITVMLLALNGALGLFPWTRPFARDVFALLLDPLTTMGLGLLHALPDLVFLIMLFLLLRYLLRVIRAWFRRVEKGRIRLESFDRDLAMPTYRIVRVAVIVFALVVAYPYIPGSSSEAFKAISIFLGLVFSIGSTSFIANIIAGYSLIYRRAFSEGEVVRIGEVMGTVIDQRLMITTIRTPRNELVNVPNATIANSTVVNYSKQAAEGRLLLHTEVGIGYDTPWREVHEMLLEAARSTRGLLASPAPFVLQRELGDFTVVYELNAYCADAGNMRRLYSDLHANIQDAFNARGVQIMSPHYEADPAEPKIVPPERWHVLDQSAPTGPEEDTGRGP